MRILVLTLLLLFLLNGCTQRQEEIVTVAQTPILNHAIVDSLEVNLNRLYGLGFFKGFGVAIVNEEGTLFEMGLGLASSNPERLYTSRTIQNIASISKTLIGISLLKAHELGALKLDDPVNKFLPFEVINPHFPDENITIRHLATHTSSITDTKYYDDKSYVMEEESTIVDDSGGMESFNSPSTKTTFKVFLEKLLSRDGEWYEQEGFLNQPPGKRFEYSNVGATLAALVLEEATGTSYDEFTNQHILQPLGIRSSGWSYQSVDNERHSTLYSTPSSALPKYSLITYPDGGFRTSAHDLAKYLTELINGQSGRGKLLTQASYDELFKPQLDSTHFEERDAEFSYNDEYNSGIFMGISGTGNIGHTGGDPGVSSLMFFDPKTKIGRYLVVNTSINSEEGARQFFEIMELLGKFGNQLVKRN